MNPSHSALGLPATNQQQDAASERRILILSGPCAQHVARITECLPHGSVRAVVVYGHTSMTGRPLTLTSGSYVRTTSPTCPALPRPRQVPALAAG